MLKRHHVINLLLLLPQAVVSLLLVLRHEPWRDETHAWLLARGPASLGELLAHIRVGEVSPPLWHLLLRALSLFSDNFLAVSLLHWAIMVAALAVLIGCAPFTRLDKLLITLGYYLLYEYAVVARHYGLSVLLVFAFLAVAARPRARAWAPLLLALLAQSNLFGLFFAAALWPLTWRWPERSAAGHGLVLLSLATAGYYVTGLGASVAAGAGSLPGDTVTAHAWRTLVSGLQSIWFQIGNTDFWWPQRMLDHRWLQYVAAACVAVALTLLAPRDRFLRLYYVAMGAALLGLYLAMRGATSLRHLGFLQLYLWIFLWLDGVACGPLSRLRAVVLRVLLVGSVWGSVGMARFEWSYPYSMAQATAQEIERMMKEDGDRPALWASLNSGPCEGLLALLPRERAEFYSLELEQPYRYLVHTATWKRAEGESRRLGGEEMLHRLSRQLQRRGYVRAYVVTSGESVIAQLAPGVFLVPRPRPAPEHIQIEDEQFVIQELLFAVAPP